VDATSLSAAYVTAGFAADGTGTVNGFTLDLGAAVTIDAAITAGTLTVNRADGVDFSYAEVEGGTAYGTSGGFNAAPAASVDGVPLDPGTAGTFGALSGAAFTINGTNIEVGVAADAATRMTDLLAAINAQTGTTGVTATLNAGALTLTSTGDIDIAGTGAVLEQTGLTIGDNAATPGTAQTGFASLDITTVTGANTAMLAIDAALDDVNQARGTLGAVQSRFENAIGNIQTTAENLTAARGRIMDADFAMETANMSRAQILQQAGTAMVAQANQLPQQVLQLLKG
jgi:flagellin